VLLACKDFSQPLRKLLSGSKESKPSKDRSGSMSTPKDGEKNDSSENKRSHTSTIFVVNREMFPTKYDDFEHELLEKILEELNHQRSAVRRALASGAPPTVGSTTTMEMSPIPDDRRRNSTKCDTPTRVISKSRSVKQPQPLAGEPALQISIEAADLQPYKVSIDSDTPQHSTLDDTPDTPQHSARAEGD